ILPGPGPFIHANHYLDAEYHKQDQRHPASFGQSIVRQVRLERALGKADALQDVAGAMDMLCDVSMCRRDGSVGGPTINMPKVLEPTDHAVGRTTGAFSVDVG